MALALSAGPAGLRTFSDLCREAQSDDVAGRYVQIGRTKAGLVVLYGATDGAVDAPVRARAVRADPQNGAVTFEVRTWERLRFRGRLHGHELSGRLEHGDGGAEMLRLRETRPDPPYPACAPRRARRPSL